MARQPIHDVKVVDLEEHPTVTMRPIRAEELKYVARSVFIAVFLSMLTVIVGQIAIWVVATNMSCSECMKLAYWSLAFALLSLPTFLCTVLAVKKTWKEFVWYKRVSIDFVNGARKR